MVSVSVTSPLLHHGAKAFWYLLNRGLGGPQGQSGQLGECKHSLPLPGIKPHPSVTQCVGQLCRIPAQCQYECCLYRGLCTSLLFLLCRRLHMCHLYWIYICFITAIYSIYIEASVNVCFSGYTITCSILFILAVQTHQISSNVLSMDAYIPVICGILNSPNLCKCLSYLIQKEPLT
jgi:hypothetical protein